MDKDDKQRESEGDGVGRDTVMNDLDGDDVKNIMSPHTSLSSPPPSTDGTKSSALQSLDDWTKLKPEEDQSQRFLAPSLSSPIRPPTPPPIRPPSFVITLQRPVHTRTIGSTANSNAE